MLIRPPQSLGCGWNANSIQMKIAEQYFPVELFTRACAIIIQSVLTFESVGKIWKCANSNDNQSAVLSCSVVFLCSTFKLRVVLTFEPVDESLICDHSYQSC